MNELTAIAILAYRNGHLEEARDLLLGIVATCKENALAQKYLSMCCRKLGRRGDISVIKNYLWYNHQIQ
jgi:hypothetical protein